VFGTGLRNYLSSANHPGTYIAISEYNHSSFKPCAFVHSCMWRSLIFHPLINYRCDQDGKGGMVGISLPSGLDWFVGDFACSLYGLTLVALPYPLEESAAR